MCVRVCVCAGRNGSLPQNKCLFGGGSSHENLPTHSLSQTDSFHKYTALQKFGNALEKWGFRRYHTSKHTSKLDPSTLPSTLQSLTPSTLPSLTPSTLPSLTPSTLPSLTPSTLPSLTQALFQAWPQAHFQAWPKHTSKHTSKLDPSTLPSLTQAHFQAWPKHTSNLCKSYLERTQSAGIMSVMEWPPQSPDLNPIELLGTGPWCP